MKIVKVIMATVALTLLFMFALGLIGFAFSVLKFVLFIAILGAVIALAIKLLGGIKSARTKNKYDPKELESLEKMFSDYNSNSEFKMK